jgi:hypothetical protein
VWQDYRTTGNADVYVQRIDQTGDLGDPAPALTYASDLPGDQGGIVELAWDRSYLDHYSETGLDHYSVWRRNAGLAPRIAPGAGEALAAMLGMDPGDITALLNVGWIYVDEVSAYEFEAYGYLAPTFADSTGAGVPLADFKILAHRSGDFWASNEMSGYSVDDLAPGPPLALAAHMVGNDAHLDWSPAGLDDEDLLEYRIYRSDTPGFEPAPGLLVATSPDTLWVEPELAAGLWYYRVSGVDIHGNEGDPSNEAQVESTTDVGGTPYLFAARGAYPNPFNPATKIRFELPAAGRVDLGIYDATGRLVRTLLREAARGEGANETTWDGRDDAGRMSPAGVYLFRIAYDGRSVCGRLALVK